MPDVQLFISAVTSEFKSYRDELAKKLTRPNVSIKVQEDFIDYGDTTLLKLDDYISRCDAVIHLAGDATGGIPSDRAVEDLLKRHPDLPIKVPCIKPMLEIKPAGLSYTHWEAYLTLYHNKQLFIYAPEETAPRQDGFRLDLTQRDQQQAHLQRLHTIERYEIKFPSAKDLIIEVLRSTLLDIIGEKNRSAEDFKIDPELDKPPVNPNFVGRSLELENLRQSLKAHQAVCVEAISGQGKTCTIVHHALDAIDRNELPERGFFYFDCAARDIRGESAAGIVFDYLGIFLSPLLGLNASWPIIVASDKRSLHDRASALASALASTPCLLFFDNFQNALNEWRDVASPTLRELLEEILQRSIGSSRIVFATFEQWRLPERCPVHVIPFPQLSPGDAALLLAKVRITDADLVTRAREYVGGHPQALLWFSALARNESVAVEEVIHALTDLRRDEHTEREFQELVSSRLLTRIHSQLSPLAQRLLRGAAIFRRPPNFEAMCAATGIDAVDARSARVELLAFFLIQSAGIDAPHPVHALVREFVSKLLRDDAEKNDYHKLAADWWKQQGTIVGPGISGIECHHHLLEAGQLEEADKLAGELQATLKEAGRDAWGKGLLESTVHFNHWLLEHSLQKNVAALHVAQSLSRLGKAEAEKYFKISLEGESEYAPLRLEYALFLDRQGRHKEAEVQFTTGIDSHPENPALRLEYALFLDRQKRYAEAEIQFQACIHADSKNPGRRIEYARFLDRQDRPKDATIQFQACVGADSERFGFLIEYARFLNQQNRPVEAEAQFETGVKADPKNPALRNEYARFFNRQSRFKDAEIQFVAGIESNPRNAMLRNEYARLLDQQSRFREAEAQLLAGIESNPENAVLRNEYAQFLNEQKRFKEAEIQFLAGIAADPKIASLRNEYGRFLHRRNRHEEAEVHFKAGIEANPKSPQLRNEYAHLLEQLNRPKEAETQYLAGIESDPKNVAFHNEYARLLVRAQRFDEAETHFKAGLAIEPKNAPLLTEYGRLLAKIGRSREAEEKFLTGIKHQPNDKILRTEYGALLINLRRFPEAEVQFRSGIANHPKDTFLRSQFAKLLLRQRRLKEACEQVQVGLRFNPGNQYLIRILAQIRNGGYDCNVAK